MNLAIADFPKPWVSLIDGVCMGGGIGVSVHGSHRVATEHALLAMPETAIALFPRCRHLLRAAAPARRHRACGSALTGARLQGAEAVEAGLATHFVPRAALPALRAALLEGDADAVRASRELAVRARLRRGTAPRSTAASRRPTLEASRRARGARARHGPPRRSPR